MTSLDTVQLLSDLADVVGAIAIVITLVYLTIQIKQHTNALHAQSRQSLVSVTQAELFAMMEHPDVALSQYKENLTPEERVKLGSWLIALMRVREFAWLQYRSGVLDEIQWRTEARVIQIALTRRNCRTWWESVGRNFFPAEFVRFVDELPQEPTLADKSVARWTNAD